MSRPEERKEIRQKLGWRRFSAVSVGMNDETLKTYGRRYASMKGSCEMSYLSRRVIIPFIKEHPLIGGVAFAGVAALMMVDSLQTAGRIKSLRDATPMQGVVSAVTQVSSFPPRWDADVRIGNGQTVQVRVGNARLNSLQPGTRVAVLLPKAGTSGILEEQRPRESSIDLGLFDVTSLFFGGLVMLAAGIVVAVAGNRLMGPSAYL